MVIWLHQQSMLMSTQRNDNTVLSTGLFHDYQVIFYYGYRVDWGKICKAL